jgi:hypothetical protein
VIFTGLYRYLEEQWWYDFLTVPCMKPKIIQILNLKQYRVSVISRLIVNYIKGTLTPEQTSDLEEWLNEDPANPEIFSHLVDPKFLQHLNQTRWN